MNADERIIHNPTWRVISILNHVAGSDGGETLSSIADATGIPVGTISPILRQLVDSDYLSYQKVENTYSLGLRLFLTGKAFIKSSGDLDSVNVILQELTDVTGETCHLAKLDGGNVLYISKIESVQSIRMYSAIGKVVPAYGTGLGKALLSGINDDGIRALYPAGLAPLTEHTVTNWTELLAQIGKVRETGFAYESEESNYGVTCIAHPLMKRGKVAAAISVGIPIFRYSEDKRKVIEEALIDAGQKLEKVIEYLDFL